MNSANIEDESDLINLSYGTKYLYALSTAVAMTALFVLGITSYANNAMIPIMLHS
jgi:hypothetical protein